MTTAGETHAPPCQCRPVLPLADSNATRGAAVEPLPLRCRCAAQEVIWSALRLRLWERTLRLLAMRAAYVLLLLTYVIPVSAVQGLLQVCVCDCVAACRPACMCICHTHAVGWVPPNPTQIGWRGRGVMRHPPGQCQRLQAAATAPLHQPQSQRAMWPHALTCALCSMSACRCCGRPAVQVKRLEKWPVLKTLLRIPIVRSLVSGLLPGAVLRLFVLLLPLLLSAFVRWAGAASLSEVDFRAATLTFNFQVRRRC